MQTHVISGCVFSVLAYNLWGVKGIIGFFCFASFLDLDHYLEYVLQFKKLSIAKAYQYFNSRKGIPRFSLCVLHTIEFFLLFTLLTFYFHTTILYASFAGFALHGILDILQGLYYKRMHYRWWSVIRYLRVKSNSGFSADD